MNWFGDLIINHPRATLLIITAMLGLCYYMFYIIYIYIDNKIFGVP